MSIDEFVVIQDHPRYKISRDGKVYSTISNKILKNTLLKTGYLKVTLSKARQCLIHILLAKAFIPNPGNKPHVHHKDENPANNQLSNLQWVTHKENIQYSCKSSKSYLYKEKIYYATKPTGRGDFKTICKRHGWDFEKFIPEHSGTYRGLTKMYYFKEKATNG